MAKTKKKLYTVIIGGEYFPGDFFSSEKEAVNWAKENNYDTEEFDVLKLHANYRPAEIQSIRTLY